MRRRRRGRRGARPDRPGACSAQGRRDGGRRDDSSAAKPRQGDDRAVQISAFDQIRRRLAEDPDRQDPALSIAGGSTGMTQDLFERTRALFDLPEGVIYLDGNSLGAMPKAARERVRRELDESWGRELIRAWNTAGWIDMPSRIGDRIGALIGAPAGSVMAADSTSVNLYKALNAALRLAGPVRGTILSDSGNFPTDLYIAEGVIETL